jgi:glycosyltransferase involved in cell wall biosynthesis
MDGLSGRPDSSVKESSRSGVLFIDNYRDTGIGTFGVSLFGSISAIDRRARLEFTRTTILEGLVQCLVIFRHRGPVIANVGLTSWGRSRWLNLLGFLSMGARALVRRTTVILMHNVVEVTEEGDTGYRVDYVTRLGAGLAIRSNSAASFVVFSAAIGEVLTRIYECRDVTYQPLHCPPVCPVPTPGSGRRLPTVVSIGYLSPYKGIDRLIEAYKEFRQQADLLVIGRPHPVLLHDPTYSHSIDQLTHQMRELGVTYVPYVEEAQLCAVLTACTLGVLPYTSTTGTSASFTTLASAGLPVIASDLREFRDLAAAGAGIYLSKGDPSSLAKAVKTLLGRPVDISSLSRKQFRYAADHQLAPVSRMILDKAGRRASLSTLQPQPSERSD